MLFPGSLSRCRSRSWEALGAPPCFSFHLHRSCGFWTGIFSRRCIWAAVPSLPFPLPSNLSLPPTKSTCRTATWYRLKTLKNQMCCLKPLPIPFLQKVGHFTKAPFYCRSFQKVMCYFPNYNFLFIKCPFPHSSFYSKQGSSALCCLVKAKSDTCAFPKLSLSTPTPSPKGFSTVPWAVFSFLMTFWDYKEKK